jgi:hypothetical protein
VKAASTADEVTNDIVAEALNETLKLLYRITYT